MPPQGAVQRRFAAPAIPEMEGAGAADADLQNQPAAPADDEEARAQARMLLHVAALEDKDDLKQRIAEAKTEMRAKSPSALTLFTVAAMHADFVAHIGAARAQLHDVITQSDHSTTLQILTTTLLAHGLGSRIQLVQEGINFQHVWPRH